MIGTSPGYWDDDSRCQRVFHDSRGQVVASLTYEIMDAMKSGGSEPPTRIMAQYPEIVSALQGQR